MEIRAHIKMEKQFKKLAEETDEKYKKLSSEFDTVKEYYN